MPAVPHHRRGGVAEAFPRTDLKRTAVRQRPHYVTSFSLPSALVLVPNGALWRRGRLEIDEGMLRQIFTSSPQFMTASSQVTTVIYALVFFTVFKFA